MRLARAALRPLCALFALAACSPGGARGGAGAAPLTQRWEPIRRERGPDGSGREVTLALLVPVRLEPLPGAHWMQLDLGSNASAVYGRTLSEVAERAAIVVPRGSGGVAGRIAGARFPRLDAVFLRDFGSAPSDARPDPPLGVVGLSFLRHRVLVLDLARDRVAILDSGEAVPRALEARATWVKARRAGGHLLVPVRIGGREHRDFILDSGSHPTPLLTWPGLWSRLTGRRESDASLGEWAVASWGRTARLVGAPTLGALEIGGVRRERPMTYTDRAGLPHLRFRDSPAPVDGLLGTVVFEGLVLVVDVARSRVGILDSVPE